MKTIKQLQKEIEEIKQSLEINQFTTVVKNRHLNRIAFLKTCIMYLQANPERAFVHSELTRCEEKLKLRESAFDESKYADVTRSQLTKLRNEHEKTYDIPKLKTEIKTLEFLLG